MCPRPQYFARRRMLLMLLLLLLGTVISSQQQEEKQRPLESEAVLDQQYPIPVLESQTRWQSESQAQLQEKRQHQQLQEGEKEPPQRLPPPPPQKEDAEQQVSGEEEEVRLAQPQSREGKTWEVIQKQQGNEPEGEEIVAQKQEQFQEGEQADAELLPVDLPTIQERRQPQEKQGGAHHVPKISPQKDGEQNLQYSSSGQPLTDLSSKKRQDTMEPREEKQLQTQKNQQHQQRQQQLENADEQEQQHHQELHPQQEMLHQQSQKLEIEEDAEVPLPSNLPSLRWGETAQLFKCCPHDSALVHHPGGDPPACQVVPLDQRWRPLLLNGRSGQRTPPDARSALVSGNVSCSSQHFWLNSADGDEFELLTTGHLYLRRSDALMEPLSFCVDQLLIYPDGDDTSKVKAGQAARVCTLSLQERRSVLDETTLMPVCARHTCLRKCCPRGLKIRWEDQLCVPQTGARPWEPEFRLKDSPAPDFHTVSGNPPCRTSEGTLGKVFALQPAYYDEDRFFLREDGRLWVPHQEIALDLEDFCVDQVEYEHPQQPGVLVDYHAAIVCFGESGASVRVSAATYVYRALLLVSALFLVATLVVYCSVPELRNLHGRCLMSHVAALLAAYGSNLAGQLAPVYSNMVACQVTALVMYFSFLAACFWLNAMSFDIWLTFSRIRSASSNRSQTGRFVRYSLYCWGCPLVLTAVVITMQFLPDHVAPPENFIRPRLGEMSCWFPGSWQMLVYFHAPILLLMFANFIFFVLTAKNLLQTEKDTRMAGRQRKGTERFKIYVNLFIVMGITWIAEALSIHMGPKAIWFVTDVFNALQGFFIFLLFTLRQNTRNIIRKHFAATSLGRCCCKVTSLVPGLSSRKTNSTSAQGSGSAGPSAPAPQDGNQAGVGHAGGGEMGNTPV